MVQKKLLIIASSIFLSILGFQSSILAQSHRTQEFWVPANPPKAHYQIDAQINLDSQTIEGTEIIALVNSCSHSISQIAIRWTLSQGSQLDIRLEGKALPLVNPKTGPIVSSPLFYALAQPLQPGEKATFLVKFEAINRSIDREKPEMKLTNWFPRLWWDRLPTHDSFAAKLDKPVGYAMAVSGRFNPETGYYENNGVKTCSIYLGKGMLTQSKEVDGILVTSIFTDEGKQCALLCLETAVDVVKFYKDWLGFYPFNFLYIIPGGKEPWGGYPFVSGIVVIHGQEKFDTKPVFHWKWITAHEIGHQYWGEYVMDPDIPAWLWIGMGIYADREYTIYRDLEMTKHEGLMQRYLKGVRQHLDTTVDIPPLQFRKTKFDFNNVVIHGKGYSIISALEYVLGKEVFVNIYMQCLRDYGGKRLGYKEFWKVCEEISGQNLGWFFNQWVRSNNYLAYQIVSQDSEEENKKYISKLKVECTGTLKIPVPVKAIFADGSSQTQFTNRHFKINELRFESQALLKEAMLDPEHKLAMLKSPLDMTLELTKMISQMPWLEAGDDALKAFQQAKDLKLQEQKLWFKLGLTLFDGGHYKKAFEAMEILIALKPSEIRQFAALVWMGHLKDLLGQREEAIAYYKKALEYDTGQTMRHDQYGMQINRQWIEKRLIAPFKRSP